MNAKGDWRVILEGGFLSRSAGSFTDGKDVISKTRNEQHLFTRIEKI
jgi:hypothetical protein